MIGLLVLGLLATLLYLAGKLTRWILGCLGMGESPWASGLVFGLIVLLPFADEIVGRIQFAQECKRAEHYAVTDAIKTARTARFNDDLAFREHLHNTAIPIEKATEVLVDTANGARLLSVSSLFTYGGWIMRAGLNMGTFSSCHPEGDTVQLMRKLGFSLNDGGVFERSGS